MANNPAYEGQVVYLDKEATMPMKVVRVEDTTIWMVPVYIPVRSTHKGNVYNADGVTEWEE